MVVSVDFGLYTRRQQVSDLSLYGFGGGDVDSDCDYCKVYVGILNVSWLQLGCLVATQASHHLPLLNRS